MSRKVLLLNTLNWRAMFTSEMGAIFTGNSVSAHGSQVTHQRQHCCCQPLTSALGCESSGLLRQARYLQTAGLGTEDCPARKEHNVYMESWQMALLSYPSDWTGMRVSTTMSDHICTQDPDPDYWYCNIWFGERKYNILTNCVCWPKTSPYFSLPWGVSCLQPAHWGPSWAGCHHCCGDWTSLTYSANTKWHLSFQNYLENRSYLHSTWKLLAMINWVTVS